MLREIVKYGDPILETVCEPVPESEFGTPDLQMLVDDMFETMYRAHGVGLAAPQIGIPLRLTVIDATGGEPGATRHVLINPEIVGAEGRQVGEEGCLSIPGFHEPVKRPAVVRTKARQVDGERIEFEAKDLLARIICHENDHLDGVLFLNHLSRIKRNLILRKIRRLKRRGEWD